MGDRPNLHKQLLFLPTVVGTMVFVMAGLDLSGLLTFAAAFALLFVTAVPYQYTYVALFPVQPQRLREARWAPSLLLLALQAAFWIVIFLLGSYSRGNHGT